MRHATSTFLLALLPACALVSKQDYTDRMDLDGDGVPRPKDCDDGDPNVGAVVTLYVDNDGDGYGGVTTTTGCATQPGYTTVAGDCDDSAATAYPGAAEVCDGIDNNCDGQIDEPNGLTWYLDADHDGYGDASHTATACTAPAGYVADATDCDDADASVNPGAREICGNSVDEDCSASLDDPPWYPDADADGYGAADGAVRGCTGPTGYLDHGDDCDDTRPDVHPGGTEVCDDQGTDEDCDGLVNDADPTVTGQLVPHLDADGDGYGDPSTALSPTCVVPGGYTADATDCNDSDASINPAATEVWYDGVDENCDGWSDYDADMDGYVSDVYGGDDCDDAEATTNPGVLEVCSDRVDNNCDGDLGGGCGFTGSKGLADAGVEILGTGSTSEFGSTSYFGENLATGDVTGDGAIDLLASSNIWYEYCFFGPLAAAATTDDANGHYDSYFSGYGDDYMAVTVADLDGDGAPDLLTSESAYGYVYYQFGPVPVHAGAINWAYYFVSPSSPETGFGDVLTSGGDVNGDGLDDVIASAVDADDYAGRVYLVLGNASRSIALSDLVLSGEASSDFAGAATAGHADVDGDGLDDMVVGAYGNGSAGAAYLVAGGQSGSLSVLDAGVKISGTAASCCSTGQAVALAPDTNGDGYADVLVAGGAQAGLFYGPVTADEDIEGANVLLSGIGGAYACATPDLDGDGRSDTVLGFPNSTVANVTVTLSPAAGSVDLTATDGMLTGSGKAGLTLTSSDLDGDGYDDIAVGAPYNDDGGTDAGAVYLIFGGS